MPKRNWTREETLVAFNLYCRTPFGKLHARNPEIIETAAVLNRTPSALAMKCCNLAALDSTLQSRGVQGLRKTSSLDQQLWQEFEQDPESLTFESEQAIARLLNRQVRSAEIVEWEDIEGLDKKVVTRVRVNQHFFRSIILTGYQSRCAVCEIPFSALLVAAHIVSWSVDKSLRMNPRNGICLCNLHERSYDKGFLLIDANFKIKIHPKIEEKSDLPAIEANFTRFSGRSLILPDRWHPDPKLLERHGELVDFV